MLGAANDQMLISFIGGHQESPKYELVVQIYLSGDKERMGSSASRHFWPVEIC